MQLMEPTRIGTMRLRNRLVMLATHLSHCEEDGMVTDKLVEFYAARAKHNPGLIIVGGCYTEHLGMSTPTMIGISRDDHVDGLTKLVNAGHKYDVPIAAQLYHAGRYAHSMVLGEQAVSASAVECRLTRETPRALTEDEIQQTVGNFGSAALRAKKAGFDAVEIIGSAGYLINQFLASVTNQREDGYGGDLKSRARFALEVVGAVKQSVGDSYPVIYRISGEDFVPGANKLEDNKKVVSWLESAGIDCFNVTGGWHETRVPQITMDVPRGHYSYLADAIADVVGVPVIACNRINSPTIAERILARGKAQLIGMSRGFLADAEITEKIRDGRAKEIRPCVGCNQGCLDKVFMIEPVTCAVNAQAGYERERQLNHPSSGNVAVVGAGPAGLEASRVLRLRGFDVALFEKASVPGGLLRLAARIPGRGEFAAFSMYMWREMRRLDVDLQLNTKADLTKLKNGGFDGIILATGTMPSAPELDGVELAHVTTANDVIEHAPKNMGKVVILGGGYLGCYAGLFLSSKTESVDIIEPNNFIGEGLGRTTRWVILKGLRDSGVQLHPNTKVSQITSDYVMMTKDENGTIFPADSVVLAGPIQPQDRLALQLKEQGIRYDTIGSMEKTMDLLGVVHETFKFANSYNLE